MDNYLQHFGIKGMRWGVRRYQNEDRTLTPEGKKRYGNHGTAGRFRTAYTLNKIDQELTASKGRAETLRGMAKDLDRRARKRAKKKGYYSEKAARKIAKYKSEAVAYDKLNKEGADFIIKVLKSANASGKSVYAKDIWRYSGYDNGLEKYVPGKRYKVRDDGLRTSSYKKTLDPNARRYVMRYYSYY